MPAGIERVWSFAENADAEHGQIVDRKNWRVESGLAVVVMPPREVRGQSDGFVRPWIRLPRMTRSEISSWSRASRRLCSMPVHSKRRRVLTA